MAAAEAPAEVIGEADAGCKSQRLPDRLVLRTARALELC